MDWNRTKTIYIIVFLILDIFLLYQYIEKKETNQYEFITQTSTEELLKEEEIDYVTLPTQKKESYLIATTKEFSEADEEIKSLKNQDIMLSDQSKLIGSFKKKIKISEKFQSDEIDTFLKENILYGADYKFWSYDSTNKTIIYYQVTDNKMFFNNSKAKVTLLLNDDREIVSYEQTYLEKIEKFNKQKDLLPAIKAIEALYLKGDIISNSKVTKIKTGYYNSIQSTSTSQILVPTWHVVVNDEKDLFVNAFDGEVIELNTEEKILE